MLYSNPRTSDPPRIGGIFRCLRPVGSRKPKCMAGMELVRIAANEERHRIPGFRWSRCSQLYRAAAPRPTTRS
jgi:hypothetical protein